MLINKLNQYAFYKHLIAAIFLILFLVILRPFLLTMAMAAIFAFGLEVLFQKIQRYAFWNRRGFAVISIVGMILLILGSTFFIGLYIYNKLVAYSHTAPTQQQDLQKWVSLKASLITYLDRFQSMFAFETDFSMIKVVDDFFEGVLSSIPNLALKITSMTPEMILDFFVFSLALYYFIAKGSDIRQKILQFNLMEPDAIDRIFSALKRSSYSTVVSACVTGTVQAIIMASVSLIFKVGDPILVFPLTFISSFIPLLGVAPTTFTLVALATLDGSSGKALAILGVGLIAGIIDNILRPMLVSRNDVGVSPIISLIAIIGAIKVFGLSGLFLGPVISSLAINELPKLLDFHGPEEESKNQKN